MHDRELGLAATTDDPHHAIADSEAQPTRPQSLDDARQLKPRDVSRAAGRSLVAPAQLHLVGAVQPGAAHAHEHLAGTGHRVRVLFDENLAFADGGGTHSGAV